MPIGHLVFVGSITLFTTAALMPTKGPAPRLRYVLSASVNEIPHVFAAALLAATGLAWSQGDLTGTGGTVIAAWTAMLVIGLAELLRRAWRSADPSLGDGLKTLLTPLPIRPWSIRRTKGIPYDLHRRQKLDLYRRRDLNETGMVLIYLHGGGYYSGGRHREGRAMINLLCARGWTCISADYRLRPQADFEDHFADARAVLAWAHQNFPDATGFVMAGSSAGAHLSSLCALNQSAEDPNTRVDAVIGMYGYYGRYYGRGVDESPISSPLALPVDQAPPFFLAHGDRDSWVSVDLARELRDHIAAGSPNTVQYLELRDAQHGFDLFNSLRMRSVLDALEPFVANLEQSATGQSRLTSIARSTSAESST